MSLLKLLGLAGHDDSTPRDIEGVRTIVDALDSLEPDRARHLAAFAYILSRVAVVAREGGLPAEQAKLVVEIAKAQSVLFGGVEDFQVTRDFGARATDEEKRALLHCLFAVSSADEHIATIEDNEIRRISRELRIEHADYIAARIAHRQHLGVLKSPEPDAD